MLAEVAAADPPRSPRHWVDHFAQQADRLRDAALQRLVEHGILRRESELFHWVHGERSYSTATEEVEVKLRILGVLLENEEPSLRDIALIHLAHACHILLVLLSYRQLQQATKRIEELSQLGEAARPLLSAIMDSEVAAGPSHGRRMAKGLPVLGNLDMMLGSDHAVLSRMYMELGPVFQFRFFGKRYTMLCGPEANRFLATRGKMHFRSFEIWHAYSALLGAARFTLNADGAEHKRMRHAQIQGLSHAYGMERRADMVAIVRRRLASWPTGRPLHAVRTIQRLLAELQGAILLGTDTRGHEDDLIDYVRMAVAMHFAPRGEKSQKFQHLRQRILELLKAVAANHREGNRNGAGGAAGGLIALHDEDPIFLPEADLPTGLISLIMAGLETVGGVLAFMLHALFENPDLMERATTEADELFAHGSSVPGTEALDRLDVLHRIMLETMRIYPPISILGRVVANSFDFGGYRFLARERVQVGTSVAHLLPEFYPDPMRFDIDRYLPERMEHRAPGAYAPFGLGQHACLGAGLAQVQIPLIVATLLHGAELEAASPAGKFKINYMPTMSPSDSFAFKIRSRR